jgi:hypothetical protein
MVLLGKHVYEKSFKIKGNIAIIHNLKCLHLFTTCRVEKRFVASSAESVLTTRTSKCVS